MCGYYTEILSVLQNMQRKVANRCLTDFVAAL